jgi:hypothetical protein
MTMLPADVPQAGAPMAFGLALERFGAASLWLTVAATVAAFLALCALPRPTRWPLGERRERLHCVILIE